MTSNSCFKRIPVSSLTKSWNGQLSIMASQSQLLLCTTTYKISHSRASVSNGLPLNTTMPTGPNGLSIWLWTTWLISLYFLMNLAKMISLHSICVVFVSTVFRLNSTKWTHLWFPEGWNPTQLSYLMSLCQIQSQNPHLWQSGWAFSQISTILWLTFPIPSSTLVVSGWVCAHLWVIHLSSMSALPCWHCWPFLACWRCYCACSSWYTPSHHPSNWLLGLGHISIYIHHHPVLLASAKLRFWLRSLKELETLSSRSQAFFFYDWKRCVET